MTSLVLERDACAVNLETTDERLTVLLDDGRALSVPLDWYPRLLHATREERNHWQLLGGGIALEWPDVDEHISVEGLLAGRRSGESRVSIERWLAGRNKA